MIKRIYDKNNNLIGISVYSINDGVLSLSHKVYFGIPCIWGKVPLDVLSKLGINKLTEQLLQDWKVVYLPQSNDYIVTSVLDEVFPLENMKKAEDKIKEIELSLPQEIEILNYSPDDSLLELYDYPLKRTYPSDK